MRPKNLLLLLTLALLFILAQHRRSKLLSFGGGGLLLAAQNLASQGREARRGLLLGHNILHHAKTGVDGIRRFPYSYARRKGLTPPPTGLG